MWPIDAPIQHIIGSTLAQVMACCLTAPSHYLNQNWLIINEVHWHVTYGNCPQTILNIKITYLKILLLLPGTNGLNTSRVTDPMASLPPHRSIINVTMAILAKVHVICHSAIHQFTLADLCREFHDMFIKLLDKVSKQQIIFDNNLRCIKWTTL